MDRSTILKALEEARSVDIQIDALMLEIERLESISTRVTPALTGMPRASGSTGSAFEDAVIRIEEMKSEVRASIERLADVKQKARALIELVADGTVKAVMRYRYLDSLTWVAIADAVGFSERWCRDAVESGIGYLEKNF